MYSIYFNNRKLSVCPLKENTNYNSNAVVYYNSNDLNTKQLPEFMESNQKINLLVLPVEENKNDCVFVFHTFEDIVKIRVVSFNRTLRSTSQIIKRLLFRRLCVLTNNLVKKLNTAIKLHLANHL